MGQSLARIELDELTCKETTDFPAFAQLLAAALPGLATPRAVPSVLVIAVVSRILPGDIVQKLVLLAIFVLGCAGVAALLDR